MHPQSHQQLTDTLLQHLAREESLLRDALAGAEGVYESLRRGDLAGALAASTKQPNLEAALAAAAAGRSTAARALAREIGLTGDELTLSRLAAKLPEPQASQVLATRTRLTAVAGELSAVQAQNANLIVHLRSYFRGILADFVPENPARYGASGSRLEPVTAVAVQAHG